MIPYQPLLDRNHRPLGFLSWATPPEKPSTGLAVTAVQLIRTLYPLWLGYGLTLGPGLGSPEEFETRAAQPGNSQVCPPRLFLRCATKNTFLAFDWNAWVIHTQLLLEAP